jgi:cellulose biosynthesis protein BcsQ
MGQVVTFYSYKGGVGRSMALANTAVLLSKWGYRTLVLDWDLEAPGIENFFREYVSLEAVRDKPGILDLLTTYDGQKKHQINLLPYLTPVHTSLSKTSIHLISAGRRDETYFKRLREFDVSVFYEKNNGGHFIEQLRDQVKADYDFVLVDSRTGITDVGGICTIQLPDMMVMVFTPTEQGMQGIADVARRAARAQQRLPFDRQPILFLPLPSRIDPSEFKLTDHWLERAARDMAEFYDDWLPKAVNKRDFAGFTKIPYQAYFSFGETLPVIEQGTISRDGPGAAYENLAALVAGRLERSSELLAMRDEYIYRVSRPNGNAKASMPSEGGAYPVKFFISYAFKDRSFLEELLPHFRLLRNVKIWSALELLPGASIEKTITAELGSADAVLALISADALDSEWIQYEIRLAEAQSKHIVPIILRPSDWQKEPSLRSLQALPADGKPISNFSNREEAYRGIVSALDKLADSIREGRAKTAKHV